MPFVQAKCEGCGGILTVDSSLKAANCPHCGSAYVVQDSINYYNTTNRIDHLHADIVNISDEKSSDGRIKAGEAYLKLHKYKQAEEEYRRVTELVPQNSKGWLGLIVSITHDFSNRIHSETALRRLDDYANSAKTFAYDQSCDEVLDKYYAYAASEREKNNEEINSFGEEIEKIGDLIEKYKAEEIEIRQSIRQMSERRDTVARKRGSMDNRKRRIWTIVVFVFSFILFFAGVGNWGEHKGDAVWDFILCSGCFVLAIKMATKRRRLKIEELELTRDINAKNRQLLEMLEEKKRIGASIELCECKLLLYK